MNASVLEFLDWISHSPRTYSEAMDAWGTHCPRFPVWEDALAAELIEVWRGDVAGSSVALTEAGRAVLADASHSTAGDRAS